MKILIAILLCLGVSTHASAMRHGAATVDGAVSQAAHPGSADGMLQSIENANVTTAGEDLLVTPKDAGKPVVLVFTDCEGLGVQFEAKQWWVLPVSTTGAKVEANSALWILPSMRCRRCTHGISRWRAAT